MRKLESLDLVVCENSFRAVGYCLIGKCTVCCSFVVVVLVSMRNFINECVGWYYAVGVSCIGWNWEGKGWGMNSVELLVLLVLSVWSIPFRKWLIWLTVVLMFRLIVRLFGWASTKRIVFALATAEVVRRTYPLIVYRVPVLSLIGDSGASNVHVTYPPITFGRYEGLVWIHSVWVLSFHRNFSPLFDW